MSEGNIFLQPGYPTPSISFFLKGIKKTCFKTCYQTSFIPNLIVMLNLFQHLFWQERP